MALAELSNYGQSSKLFDVVVAALPRSSQALRLRLADLSYAPPGKLQMAVATAMQREREGKNWTLKRASNLLELVKRPIEKEVVGSIVGEPLPVACQPTSYL